MMRCLCGHVHSWHRDGRCEVIDCGCVTVVTADPPGEVLYIRRARFEVDANELHVSAGRRSVTCALDDVELGALAAWLADHAEAGDAS